MPDLETEAFRIWKARPASADEQERVKAMTLAVGDGEKIHEALVIDLGDGYTVKILSKERAKDGLLNVLIKAEHPNGRVSVVRSDDWMTKEAYGTMASMVREAVDAGRISLTRGEDIQAGVEQVGALRGKGSGEGGERRGTPSSAKRGARREVRKDEEVESMRCGNCNSKLRTPSVDEVGFGIIDLLCPVCGMTYTKKGKQLSEPPGARRPERRRFPGVEEQGGDSHGG
jgi:hypothetical protein